MKVLRTLGSTIGAIALVLGLFVATSYAQPGHARWEGNNGRHLGWYKGRHNGWNKRHYRGWDNDYDEDDGYYRRSRSRYYGYRNYYPTYGYRTYNPNYGYGVGSTILNVLGLGGYRSYGYNNGYYGAPYLTSGERRKLVKRYMKDRRKNYRHYGW